MIIEFASSGIHFHICVLEAQLNWAIVFIKKKNISHICCSVQPLRYEYKKVLQVKLCVMSLSDQKEKKK